MAQFGIDLYSKSKYGPNPSKHFSISPFTATQVSGNTAFLQWGTPVSGNGSLWQGFRLVRSTAGVPTHERDGSTLLEFTSSDLLPSFKSYSDSGLTPGKFYYYGIFLTITHRAWDASTLYGYGDPVSYGGKFWVSQVSTNVNSIPSDSNTDWSGTSDPRTWYLSGSVSILVSPDYGHSRRLYDAVPRPYRSSAALDESQFNPDLARFLSVFGFQLDTIQAEYEMLGKLNDTRVVNEHSLDALAHQLGFEHERTAAPRLKRLRTRTHADLMRTKGSVLGLQNALNAVVGYDSLVTIDRNQMLNVDQSDLGSLTWEDWDKDVVYAVGERVRFSRYLYSCLVAGRNHQPTGTAVADTYWAPVLNSVSTSYTNPATGLSTSFTNPATGGVSTWGVSSATGTPSIKVAVGLDSPVDISNNGAGFAITTGATSGPSLVVVTSAAPLVTPAFVAGTSYPAGAYVIYNGLTYLAGRKTSAASVPGLASGDWQQVRVDPAPALDREQLISSAIPLPKDLPYADGHPYNENDIVITWDNKRWRATFDGVTGDPQAGGHGYGEGGYGIDQVWGGIEDNNGWEYLGQAGDAWCMSAYLRGAAGVTATASIDWYDVNGKYLTTADAALPEAGSHVVASGQATVGSAWSRVWIAARPPVDQNVKDSAGVVTNLAPRAAFAVLKLKLSGVPASSTVYMRCVQFEVAQSPTDFVPARKAIVNVLPQRTNWCANPGADVSLTGWQGRSATLARDVSRAWVGSASLLCSPTGGVGGAEYTTDGGIVADGEPITISGYVSVSDSVAQFLAEMQFLDVDGNLLGVAPGPVAAASAADTWVRVQATGVAPVGTMKVVAGFYRVDASAPFFLDGVLIEKTDAAREYFDGDSYSADFIWEGTVGLSRSHYYEGFRDKRYRMEEIVSQHIPLGTSFDLLFAQAPALVVPSTPPGVGNGDVYSDNYSDNYSGSAPEVVLTGQTYTPLYPSGY